MQWRNEEPGPGGAGHLALARSDMKRATELCAQAPGKRIQGRAGAS